MCSLFRDSNKLTNQMQQFYKFITWHFVSLNMFRAPPRPSSGPTTALTASGFTLERGGSSLVGRGMAGYK